MLSNAAKYTMPGGRVSIAVSVQEAVAEIAVCDTGRGIDAALLPRIFDVFVQADTTLARTEGGLGLGLPLVKGVIEIHGGSVRAESPGIGKGASFVVRVPVLPDPPSLTEDSRTEVPSRAPVEAKFLIVDDNQEAADSLAGILKLLGRQAEVVYDGDAAVAHALATKPSVVLCDIGLPGRSGYEVAEALRGAGMTETLLIAVTGYARE